MSSLTIYRQESCKSSSCMCVLQLGNPNQLLFSDSWGGEHVVLVYECGPGIAEQKSPQVMFICKELFKTVLYHSFLFY